MDNKKVANIGGSGWSSPAAYAQPCSACPAPDTQSERTESVAYSCILSRAEPMEVAKYRTMNGGGGGVVGFPAA